MPLDGIETGVERKLSDIRIEQGNSQKDLSKCRKPRRGVRKEYPSTLFPSNNTPTDGSLPFLSTAARAENRRVSSRKISTSMYPTTPLRSESNNLKSRSTVKQDVDKRIFSCPMSEKAQKTSFMSATSSSLQKQQNSYSMGSSPTPNMTQKRINSSTLRRLEYARQLNQRRTSKWTDYSSFSVPSDITNLNYDLIDSRSLYELDQHEVDSPSKLKVTRYENNGEKNKENSATDFPGYEMRERDPSNVSSKICDIYGLFEMIYKKDMGLFKTSGYDKEFEEVASLDPQSLMNLENVSDSSLNIYERGEILRKNDLYFVSERSNTNKNVNIKNYSDNFGFDDKMGNYVIVPHDHINFRYEIEDIMGNGSFGNVVKCLDHKYHNKKHKKNLKTVAIKIIKNDLNWSLQAVSEIKLLKQFHEKAGENNLVLHYIDHFHFRGHTCIVTELLSLNLYTLLEMTNFQGLSLEIIKPFAKKILEGIQFIHMNGVIHCDIKPENIMIKLPHEFNLAKEVKEEDLVIKIIDFGSSCYRNEISYTYIQSRYYRAPEVVLGARYNEKIDIWSFGCVIAELATGKPLLAGKNELEHIGLMLELFGAPKSSLILRLRKTLTMQRKSPSTFSFEESISRSQFSKIDEKSIKRTLLFTLFDINGMINLHFLNYRISRSISSSGLKRQFKPNSKSLEFHLKLDKAEKSLPVFRSFLSFLDKALKWDPCERFTVDDLLKEKFLS
ncbi:uncharacterized protein PRCAT00002600001 [Priceomyces carsonii]|uniref:uncharacterized protein n=1 Tax=Priceomyces carsonii TaxID=28549 RepID=UPI002ED7A337|nr:unnamed protein product [Priceomyces carsonii]